MCREIVNILTHFNIKIKSAKYFSITSDKYMRLSLTNKEKLNFL